MMMVAYVTGLKSGCGGTWVALSTKPLAPGFGSSHDLLGGEGGEIEPHVEHHRGLPAEWKSVPLPCPLPLLPPPIHMSFSLSQINKSLKKYKSRGKGLACRQREVKGQGRIFYLLNREICSYINVAGKEPV